MEILIIIAKVLSGLFQGFVASIVVIGLLYVPGITFFILAKKLQRKRQDDKQDKK